ncbi:hypothetical protein ACRAWF_32400 [Streptomyces sp. L7]
MTEAAGPAAPPEGAVPRTSAAEQPGNPEYERQPVAVHRDPRLGRRGPRRASPRPSSTPHRRPRPRHSPPPSPAATCPGNSSPRRHRQGGVEARRAAAGSTPTAPRPLKILGPALDGNGFALIEVHRQHTASAT